MFTERRLGAWFEKIRLEWRGFGKTKYLPFIVNYIVLPLFVVVCANASYMNKEDYYFAENGSYFIPFMSVWWMILILQEYVEGIGSEVIRIYDKNKMPEMFFYFAIYILSIIPISVFAVKVWKVDVDTIEMFMAQSVFYFGLIIFMTFTFRSILAAVVSVLGYTLLSQSILDEIWEKFRLNDFRDVKGYIFVGVCLLILGIVEKRRKMA